MGKSGNPAKRNQQQTSMRIGWTSNSPWANTGYGSQTAQVTTRMKRAGHDVAVFSNYGLEGANSEWNGIPVYQRGADLYSNDVVPAHMHHWTSQAPEKPSILFTLYDVWVYKGARWADWNVASWIPIDHMPVPPDVLKWASQDFVTPIAMSEYGKKLFDAAGVESIHIPHAIEKTFKPTDNCSALLENISGRDFIGVDDSTFVVGMNAANKGISPNRKAFGENFLAFAMFAKKHPDAVLYCHTDSAGSLGGINLKALAMSCGINPEQLIFVDPYLLRSGIDQESLAAIYSAIDVLLATSYGEGFGVPTIEAQACGTPVIVSDFAASTELCGDGWLVDGQPLWDAPQNSWFHMPNVGRIVEALESAYVRGRGRSEQAVEFASKFDADLVFDSFWKPALKVLEAKALERS